MRGSVARLFSTVLTAAMGLVFVPYIIEMLGDRLYGAWALVGTVTGYYGLLDLGLSSSVARFVSRAIGQGNREEAQGIIATSFFCFSTAGLLCLLGTLIVAISCGRFIEDPEEVVLFRHVLIVMGCALGLTFPARCFLGVLTAHLRYDLIGVQDIVATVLRYSLIVVVLNLDGGLLGLAIAAACGTVPRIVLSFLFAWRINGALALSPQLVTKARILQLLKYGYVTFLSQIADLLRKNIYPVLIPAFLDLSTLTPFAIAQRLGDMLMLGGSSFLSTLMPVFSSQEGRGDSVAIRKTYLFTYKISCYFGVFAGGMVMVMADAFIGRWVPAQRDTAMPVVFLLATIAVLRNIQIPTVNLLYGVSKHRSFLIANMADGILVVLIGVAVITRYQLIGVATGGVVAGIVSSAILMPMAACGVLKMSFLEYHVRYSLPNLLKPTIYVVLVAFVAEPFLIPDYVRLTMIGVVCCVCYVPYICFVGFRREERLLLMGAVRHRKSGGGQG